MAETEQDICGAVATNIVAEEELEHHCGLPADHPVTTPHRCLMCTATWAEESTC